MADKTMPERIWAWEQDGFRDFDNMAGWKENGIESDFEGAEYVRADLATGDANEPLAKGQWRWALHRCGRWDIGRVDDVDGLCLVIDGTDWYPEELAEIGPVIRPPADTAN